MITLPDDLERVSIIILNKIKACRRHILLFQTVKQTATEEQKKILDHKIAVMRTKIKTFEEILFEIRKIERNKALAEKCLSAFAVRA
jgi:hypothetical protein